MSANQPIDWSDHARTARALEISKDRPCAGLAPCAPDCVCWREAKAALVSAKQN